MKRPSTDSTPISEPELGEHVKWVRALARALVRDPDVADDLAQETLIAAMDAGPEPGRPPRPWLRGVLRNLFRMHGRSHSRRTRWEAEGALLDDSTSPESLIAQAQMQRYLAVAVDELPEPYRSTLVLRFFHELSSAQIAKKLGIPASTVRSRLTTGLRDLRSTFDQMYGERDRWRRALLPFVTAPFEPGLLSWLRAGRVILPAAGLALAVLVAVVPADEASVALLRPWRVEQQAPLPRARDAVLSPVAMTSASQPLQKEGFATRRAASSHQLDGRPEVLREADLRDRGEAETARAAGLARGCAIPGNLAPAMAGGRPRLLIDAEKLCRIRQDIARPGSVRQRIFASLKERVDQDRPELFGSMRLNYSRARLAHAAAFLYLVTSEQKYARQAFAQIEALFTDVGNEPSPDDGYALARAISGVGLGFTYDWAYNGLSGRQRALVESWLVRALDNWPAVTSPHLGEGGHSYWIPAARGTELLQMLALGGEVARKERFVELKRVLRDYVAATYGELGLSQEGISCVAAGGLFLIPAARALASVGDDQLAAAISSKSFWRLLMYSGAFTTSVGDVKRTELLQSGASDSYGEDEGWASLLFATVSPDQVPHYRAFYDRYMGPRAPQPSSEKYDSNGVGQVWALLYYPEATAPRDPLPVLGRAAGDDDRGVYLFRNRWRDEDDIQISLMGDFRASLQKGWDVPESFQLAIRGFGSSFAGGPAKDRARPGTMSTLLVDGRSSTARSHVGAKGRFTSSAEGGYVVVSGGERLRSLGVSGGERHLAVDFESAAAPALLSTVDRLRAEGRHLYTWQLNLGDERSAGGLTAEAGREAGRPMFLISGPAGAFLKGWVVGPAEATVLAGDPLTVSTAGANVDFWIVMAVGRGTPPVGTFNGRGLETEVTVGQARVRFSREADRILLR